MATRDAFSEEVGPASGAFPEITRGGRVDPETSPSHRRPRHGGSTGGPITVLARLYATGARKVPADAPTVGFVPTQARKVPIPTD